MCIYVYIYDRVNDGWESARFCRGKIYGDATA